MKAFTLNKSILVLSNIFAAGGYKLYLVGGSVRNIALGFAGGDFDVCSTALPHEASALLQMAGLRVIEKAPKLGTIETHLKLDGQTHVFEHTTFRRDYYPKGGDHRPYKVEFTKDIRDDARRRDFTMNALYLDIEDMRIVDPTGNGLADIEGRIIRAAAVDPNVTLQDDGLRIMRMARFAAELGFAVSGDLMACAKKNAALLKDVSPERKCIELKKILMADQPYGTLPTGGLPAHQRGLELLRKTGALPYVMPILSEGDGVAQDQKYHTHDVLGHGIHACGAAPANLPLRLAALIHDIGKPRTLKLSGSMHGHDVMGEVLAREALNNLRFDNDTKRVVLPLIKNHMFDLEGKAKPKTIRKRAVRLGKDIFTLLIALRRADFIGSGKETEVMSADNWQTELDHMNMTGVPWKVADLRITGSEIIDLLHMRPSPVIGKILDMLFWECVMSPAQNTPDHLKRRAKVLAKTI